MPRNEFLLESLNISESWRLFKMIAEIVDGIETLSCTRHCVAIFGSARAKPDTPVYKDAEKIAGMLARNGYGVITGGGPGIMEAGNKGATEAGGTSVGLHIHLPHEQESNRFMNVRCDFRYFFIRKLMFVKYSMAYVVMPGGMGTIDELSEAFVLAQTRRIKAFPIILYGSKYWEGFLQWIRTKMVEDGYIDAHELELITVLDTPEDVVTYIRRHVVV